MCCFENIIYTLDGYPVLPTNWRYCNVNEYEERYTEPVLVDPANPSDNLLRNLTENEAKKIIRRTEITMEKLKKGYYNDIFNRKRLKYFFII
jgi:hypothetical protein